MKQMVREVLGGVADFFSDRRDQIKFLFIALVISTLVGNGAYFAIHYSETHKVIQAPVEIESGLDSLGKNCNFIFVNDEITIVSMSGYTECFNFEEGFECSPAEFIASVPCGQNVFFTYIQEKSSTIQGKTQHSILKVYQSKNSLGQKIIARLKVKDVTGKDVVISGKQDSSNKMNCTYYNYGLLVVGDLIAIIGGMVCAFLLIIGFLGFIFTW